MRWALTLLAILGTLGCAQKQPPSTGPYDRLWLGKTPMDKGQVAAFNGLVNRLAPTAVEIYAKPDLELRALPGDSGQDQTWSVFFKAGVIYKGYYLDAWTQRMRGQPSPCLRLDSAARKFFQGLASQSP